MIPFIETIQSKEELIDACKKGFADFQEKKFLKMIFACILVLLMGKP